MIEDLNKFSAERKKYVQDWYLITGKAQGISWAIANAADFSQCPCIVVCYWVGEIDGWSEELLRIMRIVIKFYGYTAILNKPEGSPL